MKNNDSLILKFLLAIMAGIFLVNVFICFSPFKDSFNTLENASRYGSFLSGYLGVLLSFVSIIFIWMTLKNQIDSSAADKFETRYFEMIRLHRDNVSEVSIKNSSGRKVFVSLIREFREILAIINYENASQDIKMENLDTLNIAYLTLFYGVGPNSSRILEKELIKYNEKFVKRFILVLDNKENKERVKNDRNFHYVPFEGHQSRLGHYYRHLYQTVNYVDSSNILTTEQKYEYIKILRAQLSTHEQALLAVSALSELGSNWMNPKNNLIEKYNLIKNIPLDFFDEKELEIKMYFQGVNFEGER